MDTSIKRYDNVNNPRHYNKDGIECIDGIKASMSEKEFLGYLKGNTMKYLWRYDYKQKPLEDLQKAVDFIVGQGGKFYDREPVEDPKTGRTKLKNVSLCC